MTRKIAGVGDEAVESATGRTWAEWLSLLDERGGTGSTHGELVGMIAEAGVDDGWWQQQVAVGYERSRGKREVGETADGRFQIGVQRTLPIARDRLWNLLSAPEGLTIWLGDISDLELEPGRGYETDDGTSGEIRTIRPGERLRLTWCSPDWEEASTLQLTLTCPRNTDERTTLRVHQEQLASGLVREEMRAHWQTVLDDLEARLTAEGT